MTTTNTNNATTKATTRATPPRATDKYLDGRGLLHLAGGGPSFKALALGRLRGGRRRLGRRLSGRRSHRLGRDRLGRDRLGGRLCLPFETREEETE